MSSLQRRSAASFHQVFSVFLRHQQLAGMGDGVVDAASEVLLPHQIDESSAAHGLHRLLVHVGEDEAYLYDYCSAFMPVASSEGTPRMRMIR